MPGAYSWHTNSSGEVITTKLQTWAYNNFDLFPGDGRWLPKIQITQTNTNGSWGYLRITAKANGSDHETLETLYMHLIFMPNDANLPPIQIHKPFVVLPQLDSSGKEVISPEKFEELQQ